MKSFLALILALVAFFCCNDLIIAQSGSVTTDPPTHEEWLALIHALGGIPGLGTLGTVALVVQAVMLAIRQFFPDWSPQKKLTAVSALSFLLGVIGMSMQEVSAAAALLSSGGLTSVQVYLHQVYKLFLKKNRIDIVAR